MSHCFKGLTTFPTPSVFGNRCGLWLWPVRSDVSNIAALAALGGQVLAGVWSLGGAEGTWRQGCRIDEIICGSK